MPDARDRMLGELSRFQDAHPRGTPGPVVRVRGEGYARFAELGFPSTRQEEWRFTSVAPIVETEFSLAPNGAASVAPAVADGLGFGASSVRLVFVNGQFAPKLSRLAAVDGVEAGSLADAVTRDADGVGEHLGRLTPGDGPFAALNSAFLRDGAYVRVAPGITLDRPIHLMFLAAPGDRPTMSHPRVLVVVGENSQAGIVESYGSAGKGVHFTNAVSEIVVGAHAVVDHYKVLRESLQALHVATIQASLARSSSFSSQNITLGGALVRNDSNAVLDGEGVDCTLNGLYLVNGRRLVDNHTLIDHAKPHCTSHELYKGILDGRARAVFNGKIIVRPDAQKTDAKQSNKALLLSEGARLNTKPQLEIFADDVKCTHGATIGQLDADALFYLRVRGLSATRARSMLIHAFASDVLTRIKAPAIRSQLEAVMLDQLPLLAEDEDCHAQLD